VNALLAYFKTATDQQQIIKDFMDICYYAYLI